ncbi:uncharacterized protein LOC107611460 [Arachis ipaensis]|uniref:uncharacterized protein LOC107611460 n=1 Tax=Arachis ipaensis TaxID=130454 RepID=UPI000A2B7FC2|nr:uncharacterized protein LOC107611460 [Arachis ipaensis]
MRATEGARATRAAAAATAENVTSSRERDGRDVFHRCRRRSCRKISSLTSATAIRWSSSSTGSRITVLVLIQIGASGIMIEVSEGGGGVKMERGRVKGEKSQENIALIALLHDV